MKLSRYTLKNINPETVAIPDKNLFELPERVLQFGTGVLLRGLPDYFIDKANRQGLFNGRIVVVKSTAHGDKAAFDQQDGLYTLCVRGLQGGEKVEENLICSAISRVLNAATEWKEILKCAHNQLMQVIISNTTEVGIQLVHEDIRSHPPVSFPAKLLAFLYERYTAFGGSDRSGMVILPTELIPDNGRKLERIVLELAHLNGLEDGFIEWLENSNHFCNSLVDRIVPGRPEPSIVEELAGSLGYRDELITVSEVYRLWAIEGGEEIRKILTFARADEGVRIEPDIDIYRELKLRLLNGTHTLSSGLAFLSGCGTVREAMDHELLSAYVAGLMLEELAPSIPYPTDLETARAFAASVLDRFRNPHIRHPWINITVQYSSKMKMRCIPLLREHYRKEESVPELFALGFAAYILFLRPVREEGVKYYGRWKGQEYPIQDDEAATYFARWSSQDAAGVVNEVLHDTGFWGEELHLFPGFQQSVTEKLLQMEQTGMDKLLQQVLAKKSISI